MNAKIIRVGQAIEVDIAQPITIVMRTYFSSYHLWAARHFLALAKNLENTDGRSPRFDIKHRAYVTNSILSAISFIEAGINELFQDVCDNHTSYTASLDSVGRNALLDCWHAASRKSIFEKYNKALTCLRKKPFGKNQAPQEDAALVNSLRNALVHYQPTSLGGNVEHKLASKLTGKFPDNKLMTGSGNPWFPDKCSGHGCAEWAIHSVTTFADEFFCRIGVQPNYQRVQFNPAPHE